MKGLIKLISPEDTSAACLSRFLRIPSWCPRGRSPSETAGQRAYDESFWDLPWGKEIPRSMACLGRKRRKWKIRKGWGRQTDREAEAEMDTGEQACLWGLKHPKVILVTQEMIIPVRTVGQKPWRETKRCVSCFPLLSLRSFLLANQSMTKSLFGLLVCGDRLINFLLYSIYLLIG